MFHLQSHYEDHVGRWGLMFEYLTPLSTIFQLCRVSWWSALLVKETGVTGENHRSVASP
jgi:hypothetical protein